LLAERLLAGAVRAPCDITFRSDSGKLAKNPLDARGGGPYAELNSTKTIELSSIRSFKEVSMKKYLAAVAALVCVPGVAMAQNSVATPQFNGVRAEARIGYETPTVSGGGQVYKIGSAVSYGGEIGFDLRAGSHVVVGPYAAYEFSSVDVCDTATGDCLSEDGTLSAGGRIGYIVSPRVLIYGKLGYARIRFTATSGTLTDTASDDGVQGALGVNVNFNRNVYGLVEASYADFGRFEGINLQRRHVATGIGFRF
jgi:outer membrane immunogenic protein